MGRVALQRRLDEAESTRNMSGSDEATQRVSTIRGAIDAHDGLPAWHARAEAAALLQARRFVAESTRSETSDLDIDQLVATLAQVGDVSPSDIEARADFEQAAQALFEFTKADDWVEACSIGRECLLAARSDDEYFVSDVPWQETRLRSDWKGVLLGGSVNQAGGHRRTRGSK
jgi:hypothetical protein